MASDDHVLQLASIQQRIKGLQDRIAERNEVTAALADTVQHLIMERETIKLTLRRKGALV
jgi:hypothetical protein